MKKSNQLGFAAIEAVLILVIIAMVGGTGYFVWHAKQNTDDSFTNTANSTPAITQTKKDTASSNGKVDTSLPIITTTYSKVPVELQKAIFDYTKQHVPPCVKGEKIVDSSGQEVDQRVVYWSAGWAETSVGCDGGAGTVFAQNPDAWEEIAATQGSFNCEQLESHMTPPKFLAAITPDKSTICIDNAGNERQLQQT